MKRQEAIQRQMKDLVEFGVDNVVRLAPITDGTLPPNWLEALPVGTAFVTTETNSTWLLEFTVMGKREGIALLRANRLEGDKDISSQDWADTLLFSKRYTLREELD